MPFQKKKFKYFVCVYKKYLYIIYTHVYLYICVCIYKKYLVVVLFNYIHSFLSKTIAFPSTQTLPNFFFQSQRQKCMGVVTAIDGAFLNQSKFAANTIHKIITTFSLQILLQHFSLSLCKTYSFKVCIWLQLHK